MKKPRVVLTIAGSDPTSGAGLQADLKVFRDFGLYGISACTMITVQNSSGLNMVENVNSALVLKQIDALSQDFKIEAIKIGALGSTDLARALANYFKEEHYPVILDPILKSSNGNDLFDSDDLSAMIELGQHCYLVTPNRNEAEALWGKRIETSEDRFLFFREMREKGIQRILLKGGHFSSQTAKDYLGIDDRILEFKTEKLAESNTHGTGCILSAAITANIAIERTLEESVKVAKQYVYKAIMSSTALGKGEQKMSLFSGDTHAF